MPRAVPAMSTQAMASWVRPLSSTFQPTISRVQQFHMPQLVGAGDVKESGSATPIETTNGLQQRVGPHDPLHPFAVHRRTRFTGCERSDHPGAVRGVRFGEVDDRCIAWAGSMRAGGDWATTRNPLDDLAALTGDMRNPNAG